MKTEPRKAVMDANAKAQGLKINANLQNVSTLRISMDAKTFQKCRFNRKGRTVGKEKNL